MKRILPNFLPLLLVLPCLTPASPRLWAAEGESLRREAAEALQKAVAFFTDEVSTEGGYLWQYSEDLALREGEGRASATRVWVQPPGTPSVGEALLDAYSGTNDQRYLDAARKTGMCLVRGQLVSGGWGYSIEFDPKVRTRHAYRAEVGEGETPRGSNVTTLDDDTTQAALRFLMKLDRTLGFSDATIHAAVVYALDRLLEAQYPNGAWPQRFSEPPDPEKFPAKKASYPDSWSREHPRMAYGSFYTLNDNTLADMIDTMLLAGAIYGEARYREAAIRGGEFIVLAQMPDPQPAWAQQYDHDMHPAWARRFEPPAITGGESHGAMRALMAVYRATGDRRFLEPIPRAVEYLRKSLLPDGRLARFYELKTNKPLYFTKDYQLTYDDSDMPTHYAFIVGSGLDTLERQYKQLAALGADDLAKLREKAALRHGIASARPAAGPTKAQAQAAREAIAAMDDRGRWVERGSLRYIDAENVNRVIRTTTFNRRVQALAAYLAACGG
ncbi:MAG: pectate lyase [Thermoguttaceae bacterium]|jgi:PelA/Pel-15E family pectate lyase|nr:pectate lyase [Thermoguttaceae bacterium]